LKKSGLLLPVNTGIFLMGKTTTGGSAVLLFFRVMARLKRRRRLLQGCFFFFCCNIMQVVSNNLKTPLTNDIYCYLFVKKNNHNLARLHLPRPERNSGCPKYSKEINKILLELLGKPKACLAPRKTDGARTFLSSYSPKLRINLLIEVRIVVGMPKEKNIILKMRLRVRSFKCCF
jgi:hypothetical protein